MLGKIVIFLAIIASFFLGSYFEKSTLTSEFIEKDTGMERTGTGYLINPLLECEVSAFGSNQKYIPFENDTKSRVQNEIIAKNKDIQVSLYFRNLRNGPWFGIGEENDFAPASLMKLPVSLAYLKWSEYNPELYNLSFTGIIDATDAQNIMPEQTIIPGKQYKMDELIRYALIFSDNNANETLISYLPKDIIYRVFTDLNLPIIDKLEAGTDDYISVKEYASFFRILYNASYLSDINSSYLLDVMTHSAMTGGIRASIPENYVVAHKFGERRIPNQDGTYTSQFHDCGIVYYPNYPYIICVMTKGDDNIPRLESIVKDTSSIIFDEIRKRY